jgi:ATP-binding cassette subfamily B protein
LTSLTALTLLRGIFPAALAWIAKSIIDTLTLQMSSSTPEMSAVTPWLLMGLVIAAIDVTVSGLRSYINQRMTDELSLNLSEDILTHTASLDLEFFEDVEKQDSLDRANNVAGASFVTLIGQFFNIANSILQASTLTILLVYIQPWTLAVVAVVAPTYMLARWRLAKREYTLQYNRATKRRWSRYFVGLVTLRARIAETRLLGIVPALIRKHQTIMSEFRDQNRDLSRANLRILLIFSILSTVLFYGLIINVAGQALAGRATLGDVAIFFGASGQLKGAIFSGIRAATGLARDTLIISDLILLLEEEKSARDGGDEVPADCKGAISIDHLSFSYPGSSHNVIRDLCLNIHSGETIALVGENGCGKTTLVKLIANLYAPTTGTIRLDGRSLESYEMRSLQQNISFVFQQFGCYEATAADNIAYGDWENCENNPERIEAIARQAGVHDMIMAMPDGYDTLLGRRFGNHDLSGGEWQKIAMARAFAGDSCLLILDEPTASLDARSEYDLFMRARKLTQGKTTILISHRFSTVSMADRIFVMDEGRIIERGTHDELIQLDGHYAHLYNLHQRQIGTYEAQAQTENERAPQVDTLT